MTDETLGPWVRRFLLEHVVAERNLARNTQHGYRDALRQLIPFVAKQSRKSVDRLHLVDISADRVRNFLTDIEVSHHCAIATRNQRLAAIRAFAGFVGEHSPVHIEWSGQIRSIPFKKTGKAVVPYLERPEIDALLAAPDRRTEQGQRDHALLLFLYNTGARASEAAQLQIADVNLDFASVKITGKGGKQRFCPALAGHRLRTGRPHQRRCFIPTRLPQSPRFSNHSIWDPYRRRTQRPQGARPISVLGDETRQPPFHPAHQRNPSSARWR